MVLHQTLVAVRRLALDRHRRLSKIGLIVPKPGAVGIERGCSPEITVRPHLAVAVVALKRAFRGVDRYMVEVDAEPVALRVPI